MTERRIFALFWLLAATGFGAQTASTLRIADATASQTEDGAPAGASHQFLPGETVFVSWRVAGYRRVEKDDRSWLNLLWKVEAADSAATALTTATTGTVDSDLSPQDKEWMPKLRQEILLPPLLPSGKYSIRILVEDIYAKSKAEATITVSVRGYDVAPSESLIVRNIRYFRTEDDGRPLAVPAYRPGDTVWARFDITGYRLGERNRFEVTYGLEIFRESGESLYKEPEAARITEANFYPKRAVPGAFSLNLTPDLAKGPYTAVIRVTDVVGGQDCETKSTFTVE